MPKVLTFGKNQMKNLFFHSLNRTSGYAEGTHVRKKPNEKFVFSLT